jgi:hypothetical protein
MLHANRSARSLPDSSERGVSFRKHQDTLERRLLQRFGGKVGRASPSNCRASAAI